MIELSFLVALASLIALPLVPSLRAWWYRLDSRPLRIHNRYAHELHLAAEAPQVGPLSGMGRAESGPTGFVVPGGATVGALRANGVVRWESLATIDGWLDASGDVVAGQGAVLNGSCASHGWLQVDNESSFERLSGLPVHFGCSPDSLWTPVGLTAVGSSAAGRAPGARAFVSGTTGRTLVNGDLVIEAGEVVDGSLVVRGSVTLGEGAVVNGAIKCYGDLTVGARGRVHGPVFSRKSIVLGPESFVAGPCIADESLRLGPGSTVGTEAKQATVAAQRIVAHVAARVYGIVHAAHDGRVAA